MADGTHILECIKWPCVFLCVCVCVCVCLVARGGGLGEAEFRES